MMDELLTFSKLTKYEIIFLRNQDEFYDTDIKNLIKNGVRISYPQKSFGNLFQKIKISIVFIFNNIGKFGLDYNGVIGFKSVCWFLKLDISKFPENSNIHAQFATQAAILSLLVKKYYNNKPRFSFTFHAYDIYYNNKWFAYLVNNCYKAFSISEFNIKYVFNKYIKSDKIVLSRLGVNRNLITEIESKKRSNSDIFVVGLLSWFVEKKGIIYLLNAFLELKKQGYSEIKLTLAGDGPLKNEFVDFVMSNDLSESISYIGKIKGKQKEEFFDSLNAFVLPAISLKNDQDGIPVVLMEAISYGLPIISTNVSGIPEICIDEYNGYLIPERNSKALFDSILKLNNSKEIRKQFSKNSIKMSLKYDININSKRKIKELKWNNK